MSRNALVRVWPFARPHRRWLIVSLVFGLAMLAPGLAIPPLTGAVVNEVKAGRSDRLWLLGGLVVLMGLLEAAFAFGRRWSAAVGAIGMERDMRNALYRHLQHLPISFHDGWQSGQLLSRAISDLAGIRRFIGFGLLFLVIVGVQLVVVALLMFRIHSGLALLTVGLAIPISLATLRFNRRYHDISRKVQDDQGDLTTIIEESATGIRILKAFGRGATMTARFRAQADVLHDSNMTAVGLRARFWLLLRFLPALNLGAVVAIGGAAVIDGSIDLGGLATFITYLLMLTWPIRAVGWIIAQGEEARTGAERYFEVLDTVPDIDDAPGAATLSDTNGAIEMTDVRFTYPGTSGEVLRGVTLSVRPGETLAIVGATGSGKTTLAMLVPRLLDPTGGLVTIDGIDTRTVTLSSLRRHIGVAFEDPVLFSMSVRENLMMGSPDATDEQIRAALETAHAGFVYELPWGLDTRIGEQGYSLSGGQRQRLALARAVLGSPQVLVLDDPLSAVDVHTEAQIEEALASVLRDRTALLVVHRPSTLALADRVALLHDGVIAATGTHAELMASVPVYREILSQEAEVMG